ncbi:MAG TPA: UDP-glucose/GDP-mannose dehydrogenase family protein [Acidimicrobiia bacterium]
MRVTVIGAGYVGLVTGAGLAALGHRVRVGEADQERVRQLSSGHVPIFEPDLDRLVRDGLGNGLLSFHRSNIEAAEGAEVVFIAVPTPERDDGAADVSIVEWVIGEVGSHLQEGALVVLKSTVPVGSAKRFQDLLDGVGANVVVLSNPEFLREGSAVADFFHPDRIVIGSKDQRAVEQMVQLYTALDAPIVVTDAVSSEMIKYGANAYLATRVTFANAMANLCEAVGADARDVLLGMGYDRRIGFHFLNPGPGFGGSCFPKDTRALVAIAEESGYDFALLKGVIEVNDEQARRIVAKVREAVGGTLDGTVVALWGLAFKAGTDDTRDSPSLRLADYLRAEGARVRAYDPHVRSVPELEMAADALDATKAADVLLIATEWGEFQNVDLGEVRDAMRGDAIVDARNLLDPGAVRRLGLRYSGVGR